MIPLTSMELSTKKSKLSNIINIIVKNVDSVIDRFDEDCCILNMKIDRESPATDIIDAISTTLGFVDSNLSLTILRDDKSIFVDPKLSLIENDIQDSETLNFHITRSPRRLKTQISTFGDISKNGADEEEDENNDIIEAFVSTRLIDSQGQEYPRIRVIVNLSDTCQSLMEDISTLWEGRLGLKFKCGRNVLTADKTFRDVGADNGAEIVVTGGRI